MKGVRLDAKAIATNPRKFKEPMDLQLEDLMSKKCTESSKKKVKLAVKNYCEWRLHAMEECGEFDPRLTSADIHNSKTLDKGSFVFAMYKFITEVIKHNGEDYLPNTLKELVYRIQMFLHAK